MKSAAEYFMDTLAANVDNSRLTDAEFRQFVRNSIPSVAKQASKAGGDFRDEENFESQADYFGRR